MIKKSGKRVETCKTCKWHDDFSWVCSNEGSPNVADFTDNDDTCWLWEEMFDRKV